jgi:SM-20-related protein
MRSLMAGYFVGQWNSETTFRPAIIGQAVYDPSFRNSLSVNDLVNNLEATTAELRQRILHMVPTFIRDLSVTPFEPSALSIEVASHNDGAFYKRHVDTFVAYERENADRLLSAVYYFYSAPKGFSGGALRLHSLFESEQEDGFIDVEPNQNSLVVFPSWMPHEVLPISCPSKRFSDSRFAINCWILRKFH